MTEQSTPPASSGGYRTSWGTVLIATAISVALVAMMAYAAFFSGAAAQEADRSAVASRLQKVGSVAIGQAAPAAEEKAPAADAKAADAKEGGDAKAADAKSDDGAKAAEGTKTADAGSGSSGAALDMEAGQKLYKSTCDMCHGAGVGGAPRLGNKDDWAPRIAAGMDSMMNIALNGKGGMPKRGTAPASVSDEVLRAAVQYMADSAK